MTEKSLLKLGFEVIIKGQLLLYQNWTIVDLCHMHI